MSVGSSPPPLPPPPVLLAIVTSSLQWQKSVWGHCTGVVEPIVIYCNNTYSYYPLLLLLQHNDYWTVCYLLSARLLHCAQHFCGSTVIFIFFSATSQKLLMTTFKKLLQLGAENFLTLSKNIIEDS